ncbi:MAG TPA: 30S ribosomal protein S4 [Candidatus Paceibacterota bacterium]|nr:30S ribosomal protein S4 [Candidatus Paceibacterota bacterium]HRY76808.1 30S ribosomal protein S4 [Candidatus Paceibacterota bacterium]
MILNAKCRKCRGAGEKLFLKGERCYSPKCNLLRKPYRPGMHKKAKFRNVSEYGRQLQEKQKVKLSYGISERQLRRYFKEAVKMKGSNVEVLTRKLEMRLDNIVFRLGFAPSRRVARQLVNHGHFSLNDRPVRTPSLEVKAGDKIQIRPQSAERPVFKDLKNKLKKYQTPGFLTVNAEKLEGQVKSEPNVKDLEIPFNVSLIVEFYSK